LLQRFPGRPRAPGGPAYDASLNLLFVNAVDWCTTVRLARLDTLKGRPSAPWTGEVGGGFGRFDPKERWQGWLTAVDADDGTVRWKHRSSTPLLAPLTATAGGVVFTVTGGPAPVLVYALP
jgi:alcohol dehydrogenase (cytochrome c)